MTILPKAMRTMRIIALPLARPKFPPEHNLKPHTVFNPNRMLIYYHFDLSQSDHVGKDDQAVIKRAVKWASTKSADLWASFGKAPEGSWKLRTYEFGERIVDRIDFEELALKGVDPALGPPIPNQDMVRQEANDVENVEKQTKRQIPLIYPPSVYASLPSTVKNDVSHASLIHLRTLLTSREPRHRRGFWMWMAIAPLTAPFILVPYRASQYLSSLLAHGLIVPEPSIALDELYASYAPSKDEIIPVPAPTSRSSASPPNELDTRHTANTSNDNAVASPWSDGSNASNTPPRLLLTRKAIPHILQLFGLPQSSAADMYRAVEQVRGRFGGISG